MSNHEPSNKERPTLNLRVTQDVLLRYNMSRAGYFAASKEDLTQAEFVELLLDGWEMLTDSQRATIASARKGGAA